ncbi:MAG: galactose-1-phosphate uridylyltransferase [Actinomycetota bacterium]|nr:galactose-1-phosphate uridylyltransferase [Actinomycetota bacterium]
MKRTTARLSDGREILYFDASDDAVRVLVDPRELPRSVSSSESRYDPVLDEWVGIAGHRQGRTFLPPTDQCPLCPSRPGLHSEIPSPEYDVVVFENRFPSFATDVPDVSPTVDEGGQLFVRQAGAGRCEVVCFTSDHQSSFARLSPDQVRLVMQAWVDRTSELSGLPSVEQVFCFENRGEEIGVTLSHPHGQIYAYPFVTPRTRRMLDSARRHRERTEGNLFADVLAEELRAGTRVVARSEHWTAFVPAAARWPVEVHVYPHRHVPDLPSLTDAERDDFAELYLDVLARGDALYDGPLPYIAAWHQAPVRVDRDLAYLHLQLFSVRRAPGKLKYLAGSESGMGVFINDTTPEAVAARLRELAP